MSTVKRFSSNNLPRLGQKVILLPESNPNSNKERIGFVYGIMKRYKQGPLILVDLTSETLDEVATSGSYTHDVCPEYAMPFPKVETLRVQAHIRGR